MPSSERESSIDECYAPLFLIEKSESLWGPRARRARTITMCSLHARGTVDPAPPPWEWKANSIREGQGFRNASRIRDGPWGFEISFFWQFRPK